MFVLDQRQKIGTKEHMQISGLDRKATTTKIAKTPEGKVLSHAQDIFMEVDSHSDSDLDSTVVFSDDSTKVMILRSVAWAYDLKPIWGAPNFCPKSLSLR